MARIGIGVVGGGYMGKAHSAAFAAVGTIFETRLKPHLAAICGASPASGARYAEAYGFGRGAAATTVAANITIQLTERTNLTYEDLKELQSAALSGNSSRTYRAPE